MEKAAPVTMPCACCGELAALVCKGCKIGDPVSGSLVGTTRYCGVPCQKKDWVRHEALCKAIKGIHSREVKTFELRTPEPQTEESPDQADKAPTCAFCHNAAVLSTCKKCEAAPNSTGSLVQTTHYCSAMCEVVHRSTHKKACLAAQARRNLYQAGSALQQSYYGHCQGLVMEMMLMTGTLNANHMILYEKDSTQHTTDAIALHHSIRMSGNVEDQRGYFACLIGSDYSGKMGLAIKQHLKDLCTEIRELTLSINPTLRRRFIRQDCQATADKQHKILHVFLPNGETYALDLSDVQFGLTKPIMPWPQYRDEHVLKVEKVEVWDMKQ